jgi:type II restriction enzyme
MYLTDIEKKRHVDLSAMSGNNVSTKRFDFVVKTENQIYVIETNFYGGTGGGSKLNETARSYKMLTQEAKLVN